MAAYTLGTSATLIRTQLYPHIIELSAAIKVGGPGALEYSYGEIQLGEQLFECGKNDLNVTVEREQDDDALEKLVSLYGICFEVPRNSSDNINFKLCVASGVSEFTDSRGPRSPVRETATSKALETGSTHSWGISERFEGADLTLNAEYHCGDEYGVPELTQDEASVYRVRISSHLFCKNLTEELLRKIISKIPVLDGVSADRLWRYEYHIESGLKQVPLDNRGKGIMNETIQVGQSLGNESFQFEKVIEKSLIPEDVHYRGVIQTALPDGDECLIHGLNRTAQVKFQCPQGWEELSAESQGWTGYAFSHGGMRKRYNARILSVNEVDICVYELIVESTALCLDQSLIPRLFDVPNYTVSCALIKK